MMKSIVDENLVSFKVLEQKLFDYVCELGRLITQQVLENYDKELAQDRDKKVYRGKGRRKTSIKTVYGEVEYNRTVCRTKTEQGETAYVYLLDEAMQMDKIGLISTNLAEKIGKEKLRIRLEDCLCQGIVSTFSEFQCFMEKALRSMGYKCVGMRCLCFRHPYCYVLI